MQGSGCTSDGSLKRGPWIRASEKRDLRALLSEAGAPASNDTRPRPTEGPSGLHRRCLNPLKTRHHWKPSSSARPPGRASCQLPLPPPSRLRLTNSRQLRISCRTCTGYLAASVKILACRPEPTGGSGWCIVQHWVSRPDHATKQVSDCKANSEASLLLSLRVRETHGSESRMLSRDSP